MKCVSRLHTRAVNHGVNSQRDFQVNIALSRSNSTRKGVNASVEVFAPSRFRFEAFPDRCRFLSTRQRVRVNIHGANPGLYHSSIVRFYKRVLSAQGVELTSRQWGKCEDLNQLQR